MLIINDALFEMEDMADKISDVIRDSKEMRALEEARAALENDLDLQGMLRTLEDNADYIAFRPELREMQKSVLTNPKVYAVKLAENDLQALLTDVTKRLAGRISKEIFVPDHTPLGNNNPHHRKH
jgi:cell fate (sporulation/competence/biofilm development) regulator YlbF (YheA/YmcA/DUF963 family)